MVCHHLEVNISLKVQNNQDTIHGPNEAQEEVRSQYGCIDFSGKIHTVTIMETKFESETDRKVIQRLSYLGIHCIKKSSNSDIIIDVKKCITKGACCGCPLRGPARALQIQRQMLAVNHCAESGVLKGRDEGEKWRS